MTMISMDENELIQQRKAQDPESFVSLYAAYGKKVYNLAYRMTGSREDAQDITQETFLQVYRQAERFRGESQLYTWIYAIAKHLCYRAFQRAKKSSLASFETLIHDSRDLEAPSGISAREKEHLIGQIKEGCLTGLLRCLSFQQRAAFILQVILRLPVRDVAGILGKSEQATKVLSHRARQNLKNFLCRNCSVYDPANSCQCEDLLGFSLKQGWIERPARNKIPLDVKQIEEEIKSLRDVIELYAHLPEPDLSEERNRRIQELLRSRQGIIFASTKV